jgi:nucleotide-binding universal stress UspA family protein
MDITSRKRMNREEKMIKRIMVPLDGSKLAECALPYADELGAKLGAEVVLVNVTNRLKGIRVLKDPSKPIVSDTIAYGEPLEYEKDWFVTEAVCSTEDQSQKYLKGIANDKLDKKVKVRTEVICGNPTQELTIYANTSGIDLVVMSSHGRSGPSKWARGSVAEKLVKAIHVPLMMIRAPGCGDA